jgi:ATP-binding cassette subfamily A (ABC1) protein 3
MYESILKSATNNSDFSYKLRSTPYPLAELIKVRFIVADASSVVFMTSIAFSMIITAVVSYLVVERVNGLKHLQIISGMQLKAYWIGNFIFDALKMGVTILCVIGLFFGYEMKYDAAWITFLLIPFAVMPYTYVVSFIFTTDSAA